MQEEKSTNPDTENNIRQMGSRTEDKENSTTISLTEIKINWRHFAILTVGILILLYLILYFIPSYYENDIMSRYNNNSTLAGMHITTGSNLLIAFVTLLYVVLTGILVMFSKKAIAQSNEAIKISNDAITQSKKEQRIRYIEKRLENFYMPTKDILEDPRYRFDSTDKQQINVIHQNILMKYKNNTSIPNVSILSSPEILIYHEQATELKKFMIYRYLAKGKTASLFEKVASMEAFRKNYETYKERPSELVTFVKADFDKLLINVKKDIEGYQSELNQ